MKFNILILIAVLLTGCGGYVSKSHTYEKELPNGVVKVCVETWHFSYWNFPYKKTTYTIECRDK